MKRELKKRLRKHLELIVAFICAVIGAVMSYYSPSWELFVFLLVGLVAGMIVCWSMDEAISGLRPKEGDKAWAAYASSVAGSMSVLILSLIHFFGSLEAKFQKIGDVSQDIFKYICEYVCHQFTYFVISYIAISIFSIILLSIIAPSELHDNHEKGKDDAIGITIKIALRSAWLLTMLSIFGVINLEQ